MSSFFGIFNPRGSGIDKGAFEQMRQAADRPGHDGIQTYVDNHIALGHVMLRVSPESQYDQQPLKSSCGNYILVGHFRLDYRDELGDKLGLTQNELDITPDSRLAMMAYQKWKENCIYHLEGDWCCLIYNIGKVRIELLKNPVGISAIFYGKFDDIFYFGSDPAYILNQQTINFNVDYKEVRFLSKLSTYPSANKTLIEGLYTVDTNEMISVNEEFCLIEKSFHFAEPHYLCYKNDKDYFLDFIFQYSSSIRSRTRGSDASGFFLSGGLDSSSMTTLAALIGNHEKKKIISYTSVPFYKDELKNITDRTINESYLVELLCSKYQIIDANYCDFPKINIVNDMQVEIHLNAYSPILNSNSFWLNGIMQTAKKASTSNILIGQSGNYTISWSGTNFYISLLLRLKLYTLYKLLANEINSSKDLVPAIKTLIYVPFFYFSRDLVKSIKAVLKLNDNKFVNSSIFNPFYSLRVICVNLINIFRQRWMDYLDQKKQLQKDFFSFVGIKLYMMSTRNGVQLSDPTMDSRLVSFLNVIPQSLFFRLSSRKFIFKKVFEELLPTEILNRKMAQIQSADFNMRLEHYLISYMSFYNYESSNEDVFKTNEMIEFYTNMVSKNGMKPDFNEINHFIRAISLKEFCNYFRK